MVAGATTVVARHEFADVVTAHFRFLRQQFRCRRGQHTRRTEPALQRIPLDEFVLQVGDLSRISNAFDGHHVSAFSLGGQHQATAHDIPVDANRTGAADTVLAPQMRSGKAEFRANEIHEVGADGNGLRDRFAVYGHVDRDHFLTHDAPPARVTAVSMTRPVRTF